MADLNDCKYQILSKNKDFIYIVEKSVLYIFDLHSSSGIPALQKDFENHFIGSAVLICDEHCNF